MFKQFKSLDHLFLKDNFKDEQLFSVLVLVVGYFYKFAKKKAALFSKENKVSFWEEYI